MATSLLMSSFPTVSKKQLTICLLHLPAYGLGTSAVDRHQVTTDSDDENDPKAIVVLPTPEAPGTPGQRRNTLGRGPPHGRGLAPDQEASQGYGAAPCTCRTLLVAGTWAPVLMSSGTL